MTRETPADAKLPLERAPGAWQGQTYYGRPQLKPAPFEPWVVGGYIFLAGLSGASAILGTLAHFEGKARPRRQRAAREPMIRRSRYLSLLAPTIGSALLIYDLHTPKRFYNMLRIAKARSPMSIGTWLLMGFSAFAGLSGASQLIADRRPRWRMPARLAAAAQVPAAIVGAGLSTYTASLISATSTPLWAAAPRATAVRFASSSMATAAAGLAIGETTPRVRRSLDSLLLAALATEFVAGLAIDARFRATGIEEGRSGPWGRIERYGATGLGVLLPIGLLGAARMAGRRPGRLSTAAEVAALAGSAVMRTAVLGAGAESARRPEISMRFAQPDNLPAS